MSGYRSIPSASSPFPPPSLAMRQFQLVVTSWFYTEVCGPPLVGPFRVWFLADLIGAKEAFREAQSLTTTRGILRDVVERIGTIWLNYTRWYSLECRSGSCKTPTAGSIPAVASV